MKNLPAFPQQFKGTSEPSLSGLRMRDYFAAKAMQGLISSHWCEEARVLAPKLGAQELAEDAYVIADAMLKAGGA